MAREEWLEQNPKLLCYCPKNLYEQVEALSSERGLRSNSAAVVAILEEYFANQQESTPAGFDTPAGRNLLRALAEFKAEEFDQSVDQTGPWLTASEAYKALKKKGFSRPMTTFQKWIKSEPLRPDLEAFGLRCDFKYREENKGVNHLRWLKVVD